jgi:hybrid cluster-associated redox disulfide protein
MSKKAETLKKAPEPAKNKPKVTKDMTLGDVVQNYPGAAEIMLKYGLHCIGCHVASWETIEQGCRGHGMSDKDIKKLLDEINKSIKER